MVDNVDINIARANSERYSPSKMTVILLAFYLVLSVFETYFQNITGPISRYYLVILMLVLILTYKKVRFGGIQFLMLFWLIYKFLSATWAPYNDNDVFSRHLLSQIGMAGLFVILSIESYDQKSVNKLIDVLLFSSVVMGILTMFFGKPYIGEDARMAVSLFGTQADPNNLAAIYLIGITIALHYIVFDRKKIIFNSVIVGINSLALGMTGSRAGLISLVVVIICMTFLSNKKYSLKSIVKRLFYISLVLLLLYILASKFLHEATYERLFVDDYSVGGWSNRHNLWDEAFGLFKAKPIFGWGWGFHQGVHNTLLSMLVDVGSFGTLIFLIILARIFYEGIKMKKPLAIMLLLAGLVPALSIDAINKRFFWNGIIISVLLLNAYDTKEDAKDNMSFGTTAMVKK